GCRLSHPAGRPVSKSSTIAGVAASVESNASCNEAPFRMRDAPTPDPRPPHRSLIVLQRRRVDRDLVAWIRNVYARLDRIRVSICALVERVHRVDLRPDGVVAFRHAGDVDPLAAQLLEVLVCPARSDALVGARVAGAATRIGVLQQILEAERLLVTLRR